MLPLAICNNIKKLNILDLCAAPGGKSFQILQTNKVVLNDVNRKRIQRLKENLLRLFFNPEVTNLNALDLNENKLFDMVIIDAPCSSVGTIRKNPEILFRSKEPNLKLLNNIQHSLLRKSSRLLKKKGRIIYMVCSFLHSETVGLVKKFLDENKNFKIEKYTPNEEFFEINNFITSEGYFLTTPTKYKGYCIDGFFQCN